MKKNEEENPYLWKARKENGSKSGRSVKAYPERHIRGAGGLCVCRGCTGSSAGLGGSQRPLCSSASGRLKSKVWLNSVRSSEGINSVGFAVCGARFRVPGRLQWPSLGEVCPAEEAEQQKRTNKSVPCVQGDTNPGLFNPRMGHRQREGPGEPTGPLLQLGEPQQEMRAAPWGAGPGGGPGRGSRRSPRRCCVQGPRFRAWHLGSSSWIVACLCLRDDLLQPLTVTFRPVPAVALYLSVQMLVQVQTPQNAHAPAWLQGREFPQHEGERTRAAGVGVLCTEASPEGIAEQSPEWSPAYGAEGEPGQAERAPGGKCPGVQACREEAREPERRQAGLPEQSSDSGNQGARAGSGVVTVFPRSSGCQEWAAIQERGTDWRLLQASVC